MQTLAAILRAVVVTEADMSFSPSVTRHINIASAALKGIVLLAGLITFLYLLFIKQTIIAASPQTIVFSILALSLAISIIGNLLLSKLNNTNQNTKNAAMVLHYFSLALFTTIPFIAFYLLQLPLNTSFITPLATIQPGITLAALAIFMVILSIVALSFFMHRLKHCATNKKEHLTTLIFFGITYVGMFIGYSVMTGMINSALRLSMPSLGIIFPIMLAILSLTQSFLALDGIIKLSQSLIQGFQNQSLMAAQLVNQASAQNAPVVSRTLDDHPMGALYAKTIKAMFQPDAPDGNPPAGGDLPYGPFSSNYN